jgi:hypothetical protein
MNKYWLGWFIGWFSTFIVPEVYMLAAGRSQDTLSAAVWHMEDLIPGQNISQWNFAHLAFCGLFSLLVVWLIFHFSFGWWK